ncbi:MAG: hypothetical protein NT003_05185 [Candidatus Magasanikbacteria bacterium]|nr:hypothetical protein [Candidatus Magasanikbacteria bacterium]
MAIDLEMTLIGAAEFIGAPFADFAGPLTLVGKGKESVDIGDETGAALLTGLFATGF